MDVTTAKGLVIEACQGDHWPSDVLDELLRVAAIAQELSGQTLGKVGQEVFRGF